MNIQKYFEDIFSAKCIITEHAMQRLNARFLGSEINQLKFLTEAALKNKPLKQWNEEQYTVLIDPRLNFSIVCAYYHNENIMKIISFVRGKQEQAYKDCATISVSISKEKAEQEAFELNKKHKFNSKN